MRNTISAVLLTAAASPALAGLATYASASVNFVTSADDGPNYNPLPNITYVPANAAVPGATASAIADVGVLKTGFTISGGQGPGASAIFPSANARAWFQDDFNLKAKTLDAVPDTPVFVTVTAKVTIDGAFADAATGGAYSLGQATLTLGLVNEDAQRYSYLDITQATTLSNLGVSRYAQSQFRGAPGSLGPPATPLAQFAGDYLWTFVAKTNLTYNILMDLTCSTGGYLPAESSIDQSCDMAHSVYWQGIQSVTTLGGDPVDWKVKSESGFDYGRAWNDQPAPSAVPEPATWAMLILGFGAVGIAARRLRSTRLRTRLQ